MNLHDLQIFRGESYAALLLTVETVVKSAYAGCHGRMAIANAH